MRHRMRAAMAVLCSGLLLVSPAPATAQDAQKGLATTNQAAVQATTATKGVADFGKALAELNGVKAGDVSQIAKFLEASRAFATAGGALSVFAGVLGFVLVFLPKTDPTLELLKQTNLKMDRQHQEVLAKLEYVIAQADFNTLKTQLAQHTTLIDSAFRFYLTYLDLVKNYTPSPMDGGPPRLDISKMSGDFALIAGQLSHHCVDRLDTKNPFTLIAAHAQGGEVAAIQAWSTFIIQRLVQAEQLAVAMKTETKIAFETSDRGTRPGRAYDPREAADVEAMAALSAWAASDVRTSFNDAKKLCLDATAKALDLVTSNAWIKQTADKQMTAWKAGKTWFAVRLQDAPATLDARLGRHFEERFPGTNWVVIAYDPLLGFVNHAYWAPDADRAMNYFRVDVPGAWGQLARTTPAHCAEKSRTDHENKLNLVLWFFRDDTPAGPVETFYRTGEIANAPEVGSAYAVKTNLTVLPLRDIARDASLLDLFDFAATGAFHWAARPPVFARVYPSKRPERVHVVNDDGRQVSLGLPNRYRCDYPTKWVSAP